MAHKFQGDVLVKGILSLPNETFNRAAQIGSAGEVEASAVSSTELGYLSGVTGDIQDQLNDKIDLSEKGANNGVATLDAGGKVPVAQLPNSVMEYKGAWDADTNSPTLADGVGNAGDVYRVSVAGTQDLGSGPQTFAVGDFVIYSGTIWEKSPGADAVLSVNGQQGIVVLDSDDISEGSTNLYFTNERAQDAVGAILTDTASVDLTYDDSGNTISADVLPAGVDHNQLLNYVANQHIDHSTVSIIAGAGLTGGGDITASRTLGMPNVGTAGTYGSATQVAQITTDAQGRVSAASSVTIAIPASQVTDFNEAAQDAVGTILADSSTIDLTYNDGTPSISAAIVADSITNTHINSAAAIDYSKLNLANSIVDADIASAAAIDATKIADGSVSNTEFQYLDGVTSNIQDQLDATPQASPGDINEASFSAANNQASPANVTGFAFNSAVARGFKALATVEIDATSDLYESFDIIGINKGSTWEIAVVSTGDNSQTNFSITNAGQVQYTSGNISGFSSSLIKFRAISTSV